MYHRRLALAALAASAMIAISGCGHGFFGHHAKSIDVPAKLTITRDGSGVFDFKYDAQFADADGNFDFSRGDAYGKTVNLSFTIVDDQGLGLKFKSEARNAIWIVDKKNVGPDGSPQGPFRGTQFQDFAVTPDGKTLSLTNLNDDGVLYRYGLRFDLGSDTVVDDPDMNNGQGGKTGGGN